MMIVILPLLKGLTGQTSIFLLTFEKKPTLIALRLALILVDLMLFKAISFIASAGTSSHRVDRIVMIMIIHYFMR